MSRLSTKEFLRRMEEDPSGMDYPEKVRQNYVLSPYLCHQFPDFITVWEHMVDNVFGIDDEGYTLSSLYRLRELSDCKGFSGDRLRSALRTMILEWNEVPSVENFKSALSGLLNGQTGIRIRFT